MLKHAIGAYQSALQVYTRAETPMRWAEVMDNLAQVTQILGEQLKNAEALEKAAQACRAALEVRTKAETPLLWAATQNNLGSALFLLGKLTKNSDHLRGAAEAFDLATGLYRAREMEKMTSITEKNLSHVNQLLNQSRPKGAPEWIRRATVRIAWLRARYRTIIFLPLFKKSLHLGLISIHGQWAEKENKRNPGKLRHV